MERLNKEFGIRGLSALTAAAVFATLILTIMGLLTLTARAQQEVTVNQAINDFFGELRDVLARESTCTASLEGESPDSRDSRDSTFSIQDPKGGAAPLARAGLELSGWTIGSLSLVNAQLVDQSLELYKGDVSIVTRALAGSMGGHALIAKKLATVYFTAKEGRIKHCFGTTNWVAVSRYYCDKLGGSWSAEDFQCHPQLVMSKN